MAHWRLRHTYGHGAAKLTLAPPLAPGPFARPESLAATLEIAWDEIRDVGPGRVAARILGAAATAVLGALCLSLLIAPLFTPPPDDYETQIVMMTTLRDDPEEPERPEPQPLALEPEPAPVQVAEATQRPAAPAEPLPEPAPIAKREPPPAVAMPLPAPPPPEVAPSSEPVRVAREPARRPPAVSFEPLAPVPAPAREAVAPAAFRTAARAPTRPQRALPALADFTPVGEPAPSDAPAPVPSRAARAREVARANTTRRPPAFAASAPPALPAGFDEAGTTSSPASRREVPRSRAETAGSGPRPQSLGFGAPAPSARLSEAPPIPAVRSGRAAPPRAGSASAPSENLAAIPLGSLSACASDREEDERKMAVLAALRGRAECTSSAGRYRFVETRNLNAFLMWIERAPNRPAVDRCVELRLALECLGG
jgi:hypothetical protein